jgi:hypothetical protein
LATELTDTEIRNAADRLMDHFGKSGSGRGSALRLLGAFLIYRQRGIAGLRSAGFSRDSINNYIEKLIEVGLLSG